MKVERNYYRPCDGPVEHNIVQIYFDVLVSVIELINKTKHRKTLYCGELLDELSSNRSVNEKTI